MTMRREAYPDDWAAISLRIRARANWQCERCGLANGALIMRSERDGSRYMLYDAEKDCWTLGGRPLPLSEIPSEFDRETRVVLTVHHIGVPHADGCPGDPHDKMDCRDENLIALCQRDHFIADLLGHVAHARSTRARKKREQAAANGQQELFK